MTPLVFGLTMFTGTLITGFTLIATIELAYRHVTRRTK